MAGIGPCLFLLQYMVFNGDTDGQDIFTYIDDLVETDDNQYSLQRKARACNRTLKTVWSWIFEAYGGWQFDDNNKSNLPVGTVTLTSGQQDYLTPSEAITIRGVEVKDTGGTWHPVAPITEERIRQISAEKEFFSQNGTPLYYRLIGQTIRFYPAPNWTQAASLRVSFDRGISTIASTVTDTEPGFASEFHEAVAVGAALEYAKVNRQDMVSILLNDWRDYEKRIKDFYSKRYQQLFPPRVTVQDTLRQYV